MCANGLLAADVIYIDIPENPACLCLCALDDLKELELHKTCASHHMKCGNKVPASDVPVQLLAEEEAPPTE